jgi:hypothetical protein
MIDMRVLSQRFLKQESGYGSLNGRAMVTRMHTRAGLAPEASGSAQPSAKETQLISILTMSPLIYRSHVTFQGPLIPKDKNKNKNEI